MPKMAYTLETVTEDKSPQCRQNGHYLHLNDHTMRCVGCAFEAEASGDLEELRAYIAGQGDLIYTGDGVTWGER